MVTLDIPSDTPAGQDRPEDIIIKEYRPKVYVHQNSDCAVLCAYLEYSGYQPILADPDRLLLDISQCDFDLLITDNFEHINKLRPFTPAENLRAIDPEIPILFLCDRADYNFKVSAFNAGIDDYVVKPYNMEELLCRVSSLIRSHGIKTKRIKPIYTIGNYIFNTETHELSIGEACIRVPLKQAQLLKLLCAYEGMLVNKNLVFQHLYGGRNNFYIRKSLDAHVCYLRRSLKKDKRIEIYTEYNKGYWMIVRK